MSARAAAPAAVMLVVILLSPCVAAQQAPAKASAPAWDRFAFVLGDWVGEEGGNPGQGTSRFSFAFDLERRILVRKNHNEFPATANRPAFVHDDLLIVYPEGGTMRAVYFDNEDHVIHYTLEASGDAKSFVLVSDRVPGAARFRLVYTAAAGGRVTIRFEIAPPDKPDAFALYLEGTARRVK